MLQKLFNGADLNTHPIFLLGAHKSGTSLLRSIFDGHSQIFAVPVEAHYFQNLNYWVDNEYRKQRPQKLSKDQIIDNFCKWIHRCNISEDRFADSVAKDLFDENYFRNKISEVNSLSDKNLCDKYFEAIYYSLFNKELPSDIRIVEKSVENAEFVVELSNMFPEAMFIYIIRNPYSNIIALRKYKSVLYGYPLMHRIISTLYNSYYFLYKNKDLNKNYYLIKYEDLVSEPEKAIRKLCAFVEIPFEKILLTPTSLGKPWGGNSTFGQQYSGISSSNLNRWKDEINPMEIFYINSLFSFVLRDFNYEHIKQNGSFWRPAKNETFKRYIANRFYKFYAS